MFRSYAFTAKDRFLQYVTIDTQSDPNSTSIPSTEKQKNLGRLLVEELLQMGILDAHMDEHCYVYATLPANSSKDVPVICYCSHMDTSPDCSGENVKPQEHRNYAGGKILYPANKDIALDPEEHKDLKMQIGNDIITSDGTTLLGADNKAGVAEIMDAIHFLIQHPEVKHGPIKILFTPDEEIGRGVNKVDLKKLGAKLAYTVDGESLGSLENETFSADGVKLVIHGVSTHPGFAKNKMVSAIKLAAAVVERLPKSGLSPETTEKREGFLHPVAISGGVESTTIQFIIRDFDTNKLVEIEQQIKKIAESVIVENPGSSFDFMVEEQYRNMREILDHHPEISEYAKEAMMRAGLQPKIGEIRGGTDGSRLSFMGLPCPNIFAGEHAFHSKLEWVSVQDMNKAVETLVHLAAVWEERA
jgi:tripeptide aminopeptidase